MDKDYVTQAQLKEEFKEFHQEFRKEINEDFKLHIGVVLEEFKSQTQLLAKQQLTQHQEVKAEIKIINQKLDHVTNVLSSHMVDVDKKLDQKVDRTEFERRLSPLEAHA